MKSGAESSGETGIVVSSATSTRASLCAPSSLAAENRSVSLAIVASDAFGLLGEDRLELAGVLRHGLLQAVDALAAQPVLQRLQDDHGGRPEREHARGQQRQQQARAQAAGQVPPHGSRKR